MGQSLKPFYRLDEIRARWEMSEWDIASYVVTGDLVIAAVVAGLQLESGTCDERGQGHRVCTPTALRHHTGPIELLPSDGWRAIQEGECAVREFRTEAGHYLAIPRRDGDEVHLVVRRSALVFNRHEIERFEMTNGVSPAAAPVVAFAARPGPRPKFDWDGFWVEVCVLVYVDGLPPSQGALVRQMDKWFAEQAEKPPATSTVKKKLIPLWRRISPEALANTP